MCVCVCVCVCTGIQNKTDDVIVCLCVFVIHTLLVYA